MVTTMTVTNDFFHPSKSMFLSFSKLLLIFLLFETALDSALENLKPELPTLLKGITTSSILKG